MNKKELEALIKQDDLKVQFENYKPKKGEPQWDDPDEFEFSEFMNIMMEDCTFKIEDVVFEYVESGRVSNGGDFNGYEMVYKIGDSYFRWYGSYDSWNGRLMDFEDYDQVVRHTVTVNTWKEVYNEG